MHGPATPLAKVVYMHACMQIDFFFPRVSTYEKKGLASCIAKSRNHAPCTPRIEVTLLGCIFDGLFQSSLHIRNDILINFLYVAKVYLTGFFH